MASIPVSRSLFPCSGCSLTTPVAQKSFIRLVMITVRPSMPRAFQSFTAVIESRITCMGILSLQDLDSSSVCYSKLE